MSINHVNLKSAKAD